MFLKWVWFYCPLNSGFWVTVNDYFSRKKSIPVFNTMIWSCFSCDFGANTSMSTICQWNFLELCPFSEAPHSFLLVCSSFLPAIVRLWLDVGHPFRCPQVARGSIRERVGHFLQNSRVGKIWSAREESLEILRHCRELNPGHGGTDSEVHSFSHWAIMTRATGRTDSEIHSFSHWGSMTRATGRTDSEIHSFSHWAIMTRATGRTDSEIHSFSHWAIMADLLLPGMISWIVTWQPRIIDAGFYRSPSVASSSSSQSVLHDNLNS